MRDSQKLPGGVLHFPEGLPGFESLNQFVLLQDEGLLPIVFLTALGEPQICLPVMPVQRLLPDYRVQLGEDDKRVLRLTEEAVPGKNVLCLVVLNLAEGGQAATANLMAPIVVNIETWTAKQIIQSEGPYSSVAEVV
jgi:flagellar assembly factor FliW